jgi:predicted CxxxxCH...CXXCH cytochrome family protein
MRRVASVWSAAVVAWALAGCGESRGIAAPSGALAGCADCHTAPGEGPPFRDQTGSIDPGRLTVGAHDTHLHGNLIAPISSPISCGECHTVPRTVTDPGHLDDSPGDIAFGTLARTGGASPEYVAQGCAATYCHGNFPGGNGANAPTWLGGAAQGACGTCHSLPPPTGSHSDHIGRPDITCTTCHGAFVQATHVNGVKNIALTVWNAGTRSCGQACHESRGWDDD